MILDRLCPLAALLLLAACASYQGYGLKPGVATDAEVRKAMGPPAVQFANPDGSRDLAYPRGPLGTQTFMVHVGADGKLRAIEQVLDDDHFFHIQPGMTKDEVLHRIGPPGETMGFSRSGNFAWDYRFTDTWGYLAIFSVTFDRDGVVVSKFTHRIERNDRGRD